MVLTALQKKVMLRKAISEPELLPMLPDVPEQWVPEA